MKCDVSAVIITHKRAPEMVRRAIESVVNQTYQPQEIILVDDSPADYEKRQEIAALAALYEDRGLIYIQHEKCKGACAARNTGIIRSSGKYIAFLDDDDEWLPQKIEKQLQAFTDEAVGIVYCLNYIVFKNQKKIESRLGLSGDIFDVMIIKNIIGSTSFPLLLKQAVLDAGMFDEDMPAAQDYDLWLRILTKYTAQFVNEPLVNYYIHEGEQITKNRQKKANAYEKILAKSENYPDEIRQDAINIALKAMQSREHYYED